MSRKTHRNEHRHSKKRSVSSHHPKSDDQRRRGQRHDDPKVFPVGARKITKEDYFRRQTEFRVWLAQTKRTYVEDLSTDEAIQLFTTKFVTQWNHGKMATMFYDGLPALLVEQTKRTRHCWNFVANLDDKEQWALASAKDSVDVATKTANLLTRSGTRDQNARKMEDTSKHQKHAHRRYTEDRDDASDDRKRRRVERQNKERDDRETLMEEWAPHATGREAQMAKRRQVGAKVHGAARDREDARDGLDWSEAFLMGERGGGDAEEWKRRVARRNVARLRKQEKQEEKLGELKAKESARMEKFLEEMGLAGPHADGRKAATIAPRR